MSLMALHEDGPLSDYVYFPVIELNADTIQSLGASFTWSPVGDNGDRIFRFSVTNDNIYTALGANMPRQRSSNGCIMQNRNVWENVQGVYERTDTVMTDIEVGTKPDDFDSNVHYMTLTTQTIDDQPYNIYNIKNRGGWSASTHYYLDESSPENRHVRLFYTDGGLSFGVFNALQYTTSLAARYRKFTGFAIPFPASSVATSVVYPLYWGYNGSTFNPNASSGGGATSATNWCPYYYLDGSANVDVQQNYITFFVHTRINNVDYYGVAVSKMSSDESDAYPQSISCCFWASEYWGASVVPGGDTPSGQWGPSSAQGGGQGTWDYTTETVPEVDTTYLPTFGTANGGVKMYYTDNANINNLAARLYNADDVIWQYWSNKYFNPQQGILGLHYLPSVFVHQDSETQVLVRLGIIELSAGDYPAVRGYIQSNQYVDSPTYTLNVPALSDSYMDYLPYTSMTLHVPFCGGMDIDPSKVIGGTITVKFRCDISNGNVSARITMTDKFNSSTVNYLIGNCAYDIPILGRGSSGLMSMLLSSATAGVMATKVNPLLGVAQFAKGIGGATNTSSQLIPVSNSTMPISDLSLWLEVTRAIPSTPENKQEMRGISANIYRNLITLKGTGYMKASSVHLRNMSQATEQEKTTIKTLLKSGVIL